LAESQQTPLKHVGKWERVQGKFEDAKGVIRSSKSKKDRQYNAKRKRTKRQLSIKHYTEN
jgi:hypothetical protein